jgi:hypothetical protein
MPMFETPLQQIFASKSNTGNGLFTPLTPPSNSTGTKLAYATLCRYGADEVEMKIGLRVSVDGVNWLTPEVFPAGASWESPTGWGSRSALTNPNTVVTEYPFYQWGVFARNTVADGLVKMTSVKLRLQITDVAPWTMVSMLQPVTTKGSTSDPTFVGLTPPFESIRAYAVRVSTELRINTGDARIRFAVQTSDTLDTWSSGDVSTISGLDGWVTSDGVVTGSTFVAIISALTKKYGRFGVQVANISGTDLEACLAGIRVDVRGAN